MVRTLLLFLLLTTTALAEVNLLWQPKNVVAQRGGSVVLSIWAQRHGETPQPFDAVDLVAMWNPNQLRLMRRPWPGRQNWAYAAFPVGENDPDGWNRTIDDGTVFLRLQASETLYTTPSGVRLATFYFRVVGEPLMATVGLPETGGRIGTAVYNDGAKVTDAVAGAGVAIGTGSINLGMFAVPSTIAVGDPFWVVTLALSGDGVDQAFAGADLIFGWNAETVQYVGIASLGSYGWLFADFFDDRVLDGWNNSLADGDAFLTLWADPRLGLPVATPQGLVLAVFEFRATAVGESSIELLYWRTDRYNGSGVYDEDAGGLNILKHAGKASVVVAGE